MLEQQDKMEIPGDISKIFSDLVQDLIKIITKVKKLSIHDHFNKEELLLYLLKIHAEMSPTSLDYLYEVIGGHPNTSTKLLAVIVNSSNWIVRYLVAIHKNTSDDVLINLKDDPHPIVAEAAIESLKDRSSKVEIFSTLPVKQNPYKQ